MYRFAGILPPCLWTSTGASATFRRPRSRAGTAARARARAAGRRRRTSACRKHLASRLHYDLRLEHDGVLLSWAVPKGPSLDHRDRHLAVQTEDHPRDYGDFEGVIPEGYGQGIVMLWDYGAWRPEVDDVDEALRKGDLKFALDGYKLKGSWVLVRTRDRPDASPSQHGRSWLLIKHRDFWSGPLDITTFAPLSVKSEGDFDGHPRRRPAGRLGDGARRRPGGRHRKGATGNHREGRGQEAGARPYLAHLARPRDLAVALEVSLARNFYGASPWRDLPVALEVSLARNFYGASPWRDLPVALEVSLARNFYGASPWRDLPVALEVSLARNFYGRQAPGATLRSRWKFRWRETSTAQALGATFRSRWKFR